MNNYRNAYMATMKVAGLFSTAPETTTQDKILGGTAAALGALTGTAGLQDLTGFGRMIGAPTPQTAEDLELLEALRLRHRPDIPTSREGVGLMAEIKQQVKNPDLQFARYEDMPTGFYAYKKSYDPINKKTFREIGWGTQLNAGGADLNAHVPSLLHEGGHAMRANPVSTALKRMSTARGAGLARALGPLAGIAAGASGNEDLETWAPAIAVSAHLPILAEEARANINAQWMAKELSGLTSNPGMFRRNVAKANARSYGTYLAAPLAFAGMAAATPWLVNKMRDARESDS